MYIDIPVISELCSMDGTTLTIRNMVCDRCKIAVRSILEELHWPIRRLELGEVELENTPSEEELSAFREALQAAGFELIQGREAATIARIKTAIVQLVHHEEGDASKIKLSTWLSDALHKEYAGLAALFSSVEGITVEHFFLLQRIERVKELVHYGELTISEIAYSTGFSSAAHLSGQFKLFTGMTPTDFRKIGGPRTPLDQVG